MEGESVNVQPFDKESHHEKHEALFAVYRADRTPANRNALVEHNFPLVLRLAKDWQRMSRYEIEEFIAWGSLGLIRAVEGYKPHRGRFSTYAWRCIAGEIIKGLKKNDGSRSKAGREFFTSIVHSDFRNQAGPETPPALDDRDEAACLLAVLTERERRFVELHIMESIVAREISDEAGVSKQRVFQIVNEAKAKMREKAARTLA